jgi:predicted KAP-like P-loop ATPase
MKMRFCPDTPIATNEQEHLGFGEFVSLMEQSVRNAECPFVFGVLGGWGTGKTSVLRLLQERFELVLKTFKIGDAPLVPIWFNAWEYENESNIIYPLLYALRENYTNRLGKDVRNDLKHSFLNVVKSSTLALTDIALRVATKHTTGEALSLKDVKEQITEVEKEPELIDDVLSQWADHLSQIRSAFQTLLNNYAEKLAATNANIAARDVRFVVLIDDLDRCLPETAIAVLESIKNYLTTRNCIFVLGINPGIIYQGIRIKYDGLEIDGREYLEKILNYSFHVPEPLPERVAAFATAHLKALVDDGLQKQYADQFDQFGKILQDSMFTNPRKIHRILNRYLLLIAKYEKYLGKLNLENIGRLLIIAEYFPALFPMFVPNLSEGKLAMAATRKPDFDVKSWEAKYGISLTPILPQVRRMNKLFDLKIEVDVDGVPTLAQQAQDIYNLTRAS